MMVKVMVEKNQYVIGIDLGGTKMSVYIFDNKYKILGHERKKSKSVDGPQGYDRLIQTINTALQNSNIKIQNVSTIGLAYPGAVDYESGLILSSPNLGWNDVNLRKKIEKYFNVPTIILNDVDAGVYGEYIFGAAKKARCAVGIFIGTGIGGGCIYEGRIIRGKKYSAFEIGHLQVQADGPICGCGQRGCLESLASRLAIASMAVSAAYRGEAPYLFKTYGTDLSNIKSSAIAESIKANDKTIEKIVRSAASFVGVATSMIVNLIMPDVIILGGGVVEAMPKLFCDAVFEKANEKVVPVFKNTFTVVSASLGDDAVALGAASYAAQKLL